MTLNEETPTNLAKDFHNKYKVNGGKVSNYAADRLKMFEKTDSFLTDDARKRDMTKEEFYNAAVSALRGYKDVSKEEVEAFCSVAEKYLNSKKRSLRFADNDFADKPAKSILRASVFTEEETYFDY